MGKGIVRGQKINAALLDRAKELRTGMTAVEKFLWKNFRSNRLSGFHFRRQQIIFGYIADFYCDRAGLVIEIDGGIHHERQEYDRQRDITMQAGGLVVLRFTNEAVIDDPEQVLDTILSACRQGLNKTPCHNPASGVQFQD